MFLLEVFLFLCASPGVMKIKSRQEETEIVVLQLHEKYLSSILSTFPWIMNGKQTCVRLDNGFIFIFLLLNKQ